VGVEHRLRRDRLLEIVEQRAELLGELCAELRSHQAVRRRAQHELLELVVEVPLTLVAPIRDPRFDFLRDDARITLHLVGTQRVGEELDLLALDLERRAVLNALAEHRNHVLVGLGRGELIVGCAIDRLVRLGPDHQDVAHAAEIELGELAALAPRAQHEQRGVGEELGAVAEAGCRAAHRPGSGRLNLRRGHGELRVKSRGWRKVRGL
jgi:hypothetical protein